VIPAVTAAPGRRASGHNAPTTRDKHAGVADEDRSVTAEPALLRAVRSAVGEVTDADDRLRVTQTMAAPGWGDVLFVDVYVKSRCESLEDLDPVLRRNVETFTEWPRERVTIRWRISH
jgi:hypothetical protein